MKIVPSLLAETFEDFLVRLRQAESLTDYVQVDMMDGVFVGSKSFPPERMKDVGTTLSFEAHLMVDNPMDYMKRLDNRSLTKVIFHFESKGDHADVIAEIRRRGLDAGMAIRPETDIREFGKLGHLVDTLLFLTVDPGRYGSPFRPEVRKKVAETRRIFPHKVIGVDGGISPDNLQMFYTIGVDYVCVGSRIFLHGRPKDNYRLFLERLSEIERAVQ
jgi:ribulose-phosphate 3-epimerase